jgi:hypothetical protein
MVTRKRKAGRPTRCFLLALAAFTVCVTIASFLLASDVRTLIVGSVTRSLFSSARVTEHQALLARSAEEPLTTLLFVGDIMLSRGIAWKVGLEDGDYTYPFEKVADLVRSADFAFGNLEGPVSARGSDQGSVYSFRAAPAALSGLSAAGFDALSLANNHIWDWGSAALEDTVDTLRTAGITPVGAGHDASGANEPALFEVNGVRVGILAFTTLLPQGLEAGDGTPGVSATQRAAILSSVRAARQNVDILVVSMHWGEEYWESETEQQRELGHALVDAGADFVIGHHPHVPEPIERYRTGWIAYSLGNFVFDRGVSDATRKGTILVVTERGGDIADVTEVHTRLNDDFQPEVVAVY